MGFGRQIRMGEEIPFNKQMRIVTREIHAVSDALIQAKLAFAMSDNSVWAEGLLVFYEVFRYLEEAMVRLKGTPVREFFFEELMRTEAFETDLAHYLGADWPANYSPRESVVKYLIHLEKVEKENPILLIAYIYHLYMGLLSGGQILSKKRSLINKFLPSASESRADAVTNFGQHNIAVLKKKIVDTLNNIASELGEKDKNLLLEESKTVFVLNNAMVKSIHGATYVFLKKVFFMLAIVIAILIFYHVLF